MLKIPTFIFEKHVDMKESTLNGYLEIKGLTSEFPELTVNMRFMLLNLISLLFVFRLFSRQR